MKTYPSTREASLKKFLLAGIQRYMEVMFHLHASAWNRIAIKTLTNMPDDLENVL